MPSKPVQSLLREFDDLSDHEQLEAASHILRRTLNRDLPPLTDDDLVRTAEEIFLELDAREADDANGQPR